MKLLIVESPNKCATIEKYVGKDYKVIATNGHICDLATSGKGGLGVDCNNNFEPVYRIKKDSKKKVEELKRNIKLADEVLLATDPDREGEAIANFVRMFCKLPDDVKRLEFHEITRNAILNAISNPRLINKDLVAQQEARRIIDRILGFKLSEILQRKSKDLNSGGRVQSSVLKFIAEHDTEIKNFKPEPYWTINAKISQDDLHLDLPLYKYKDKEIKINNKELSDEIKSSIGPELKILSVDKKIKVIEPKQPFNTSSLIQEAVSHLDLSSSKATRIFQNLYEGIEVDGEHVGLITYIRTDSHQLSEEFVTNASNYIKNRYGEDHLASSTRQVSSAPAAQLAHEAIRPTDFTRTPKSLYKTLKNNVKFTNAHFRVYELIYNRTLSYLMASKKEEETTVIIGNDTTKFKTTGSKTVFDGFGALTKKDDAKTLPFTPNIGDKFAVDEVVSLEKQTQPPAHYSEAKVINLMEEKGIGRPSTYSPTLAALRKHEYLTKEKNSLIVTEKGYKAIDFLEKHFPEFIQADFTSIMESNLDATKTGPENRFKVINEMYIPFMKEYDKAFNYVIGVCPKCGAPLVTKRGKYGRFIGCSRYPKCDYIKQEKKEVIKPEILEKTCPYCGKPLIKRSGNKKGKSFIGCSGYPYCHYIEGKTDTKKLEIVGDCPECKVGKLVIRRSKYPDKKTKKYRYFIACTNFPKCKYTDYTATDLEEKYNKTKNN